MQIKAQRYNGQLLAPASKSHGQRLLILAALSAQYCTIENLGSDSDTKAMSAAAQRIKNNSNLKESVSISVDESGFALRSLAFVAAAFFDAYELTGKGTLLNRHQWATIQVLEQLGLSVSHQNGLLPIVVNGSITNTQLEIDASEGSQFVSGLFLLAAKHPGYWKITINELSSRPYFDMTLEALRLFGFQYELKNNTYAFEGNQTLSCEHVQVEGDWSSVAAHLVGAAIQGEISISGLNPESLQPDKNLLHALEQFGAKYNWNNGELILSESKNKTPFDFDCTQQPDLFPVLVVLACAAKGTSSIKGIHRLKNKESDRLMVMSEALSTWGVGYQIKEDQIDIYGIGKVNSGQVKTYHDHRIAMAGCVASLLCKEGHEIDDPAAIEKSYPDFVADFLRLTQA
jgi:3-phosphoshikimate 1-carboxyvinyltransferase